MRAYIVGITLLHVCPELALEFGQHAAAHLQRGDSNRMRDSLDRGMRVAFYHNTTDTQKRSTVVAGRIIGLLHARSQSSEAGPGEYPVGCRVDLAQQHRDRAFGGLEEDIAGKPVADNHVGGTGENVVALDETDEIDIGGCTAPGRFTNHVGSLVRFAADVEQADARLALEQ